jgi:hypothetical protein
MNDSKQLLEQHYHELVRVQGTEQIITGVKRVRFNREKPRTPLLDQLGREIAQGALPTAPAPMAAISNIVMDTGYITFDGGVPVGGYANAGVFPNGAFNFSGHFHDSGFPGYNVGCVIVIRLSDVAFVLPPFGGSVGGTLGGGSRDVNWNVAGTNPTITPAWPTTDDGYDWSFNASANIDIQRLIDSCVKVIGTVGTVVVLVAS